MANAIGCLWTRARTTLDYGARRIAGIECGPAGTTSGAADRRHQREPRAVREIAVVRFGHAVGPRWEPLSGESSWSGFALRAARRRAMSISGRIIEDGKIEAREAFGIKYAVNLDDLPARDREPHHREGLSVEHDDYSRGAVHERGTPDGAG